MKKTIIIFVLLSILGVLASCRTTPLPIIIPDTTPDNVVIQGYKDQIEEPGPAKQSYSWLFWYAPICVITLMWAYRELIRKPVPKQCVDSNGQLVKETQPQTKVKKPKRK